MSNAVTPCPTPLADALESAPLPARCDCCCGSGRVYEEHGRLEAWTGPCRPPYRVTDECGECGGSGVEQVESNNALTALDERVCSAIAESVADRGATVLLDGMGEADFLAAVERVLGDGERCIGRSATAVSVNGSTEDGDAWQLTLGRVS